MKIVIIGGVAGGANTAARLRRLDEHAEIIIFERGGDVSYANCGLPYLIGGKVERAEALRIQTPETLRERYNIDVRVFCEVKAIDRTKKTVTVEDLKKCETRQESYDKLVIATGAEPIVPPIPGIDSERVFTLRTIPDAAKISKFIEKTKAKSAVLIGGGGVGLELAENLQRLGLGVTIVELADHLVAPLDADMAAFIQAYAEENNVRVITGNGAKSVEETPHGLVVKLGEGEVKADMIILAVGVRPDSTLAKEAGLELGERGAIVVNKQMQTADPDIYAVGDAVQTYNFITGKAVNLPLAGPASRQARVAADNLAGIPSDYAGVQGSGIIKFFEMTVAFTGLSEREAEQNGINFDKVFLVQAPHAQYYPGGREMNMKVVFERGSDKILGAQIVGFDGVDKRCDVLAMAIRMGATAGDLMDTDFAYSPPFGTPKDPVNVAGQVIDNLQKKRVSLFYWDDLDKISLDDGATLLDVRKDLAAGEPLEGFEYVPLEELRAKIAKLEPDKPVYIYCGAGQRSYIAGRILKQRGFKAHSFAGGYKMYMFYNSLYREKQKKKAYYN